MEGAKEEEKSDVYSTTMTEAMGAGKYYGSVSLMCLLCFGCEFKSR